MEKNKVNLTIILLLMIITGFILYYMYLKPETFYDCITNPTDPACRTTTTTPNRPTITCPDPNARDPVAIVSRYFGVGFNIYPVTSSSSNILQNKTYLIEHIPITTNGVAGGMYSISSEGTFTIKLKNNDDPTQWWSMIELKDTDDSVYEVMIPNGSPNMALQYANGNLSLRPYTAPGFEGQKWLKSYTTVTRGIPVLNYSPSSMFTTEFDPYSTSSSYNINSLSDANSKQVSEVVNAVKSGIQQYLKQTSNTQLNGQLTSSSLGNKDMPLSVNLNLGGGNSVDSSSGVSYFENVAGSSSNQDVLSMLDKYDSNSTSGSKTLYTSNDLQNQLNQTSGGCKLINIDDYTPNRVSTCNCKL